MKISNERKIELKEQFYSNECPIDYNSDDVEDQVWDYLSNILDQELSNHTQRVIEIIEGYDIYLYKPDLLKDLGVIPTVEFTGMYDRNGVAVNVGSKAISFNLKNDDDTPAEVIVEKDETKKGRLLGYKIRRLNGDGWTGLPEADGDFGIEVF